MRANTTKKLRGPAINAVHIIAAVPGSINPPLFLNLLSATDRKSAMGDRKLLPRKNINENSSQS